MLNLLLSLYNQGLIVRTQYDQWRGRIFRWILRMIPLTLIPIVINCLGFKQVNVILGLAVALVALYYAFVSEALIGAAAIGAVSHPFSSLSGIAQAEKAYAQFVCGMVLWISFLFLVLSTFQISRNPWTAIPIIYLALFIVVLMDLAWGVSIFFSRAIVVVYTIVVLALEIGSLISAPVWKNAVGVDPFFILRVSGPEIAVSNIDDKLAAKREKADKRRLEAIEKKLEASQSYNPENDLSLEDQIFLNEQRQKAKEGSFANRFSSSTREASSAPPQWWTDEIVLGPGEKKVIANVSNGDVLRSWSTSGVIFLEGEITPATFPPEVDMTSRFVNFVGQRSIAFEAGNYTTTVRYLLKKK